MSVAAATNPQPKAANMPSGSQKQKTCPGTVPGHVSVKRGGYVRGAAGNCPRISPAGFFFVWTFTYACPDSSALRTDSLTVALPRAPLRQGAQSGTMTGPDL